MLLVMAMLMYTCWIQIQERRGFGDYYTITSNIQSDHNIENLIAQFPTPAAPNPETLELYAKSAALIDGESKRLLYGKDAYRELPMASTTKIMTCSYAIEHGNLNDIVTISKRAAKQPKTHLGMAEGEQYLLKDLLYALMLESCNDTAVAIAEHIGGSVENFCNAMTEEVKTWGLEHTSFVTPNGLDADGHYTTAYELALIGAKAIENQQFLEIVNTPQHRFATCDNQKTCSVHNKDAFLHMMNGAVGIKTGYTSKASYCFVGAVEREGRTYISSVLSSGWYPRKTYKWKDTKKLMEYGIRNYQRMCVLKPSVLSDKQAVDNGQKKQVAVKVNTTGFVLMSPQDRIVYQIRWNTKKISAPVKQGMTVGQMMIQINDETVIRAPIYTAEGCKERTFCWCLKQILMQYL